MKTKYWLLGLLLASTQVVATGFESVTIKTDKVRGTVHMLSGAGGNIGVSAGKDGLVVIDDQFAELSDKIKATLKPLSSNQRMLLINTHYHGDHTGGNAQFADDALIMAHENVRVRLANKHDSKHLPVVTYQEGIKIYLNDETIHIRHLPKGHTDGDSFVYFEKANVIHAGDLFFQGRFPYIDKNGGGSVDGYIASMRHLIEFANDDTLIIPGHGVLANKQEYQRKLDMILQTREWVRQQQQAGKSLEHAIKAGLPKQWKEWSWQFIDEIKWITTLWE